MDTCVSLHLCVHLYIHKYGYKSTQGTLLELGQQLDLPSPYNLQPCIKVCGEAALPSAVISFSSPIWGKLVLIHLLCKVVW